MHSLLVSAVIDYTFVPVEKDFDYFSELLSAVLADVDTAAGAQILLRAMRSSMTKLEEAYPDEKCSCDCLESRWKRHHAAMMVIKEDVARCRHQEEAIRHG